MSSLKLALAFLTILPVRLRGEAPPLGSAAPWFPLVGLALGGAAGALGYALQPTFGPAVAQIAAVAALVVLTGGLHQDGLADCADSLGARDRARKLEVMRDSAIGTFGTLALILGLGLLIAALAGLSRTDAWCALAVAAASGRWAAVIHAKLGPPARPDGLGAAFAPPLTIATVLALAAALGVAGPVRGAEALAAAAAVAALVAAWARDSLGGRTGDTLGATVALAEVAVALVFAAN